MALSAAQEHEYTLMRVADSVHDTQPHVDVPDLLHRSLGEPCHVYSPAGSDGKTRACVTEVKIRVTSQSSRLNGRCDFIHGLPLVRTQGKTFI